MMSLLINKSFVTWLGLANCGVSSLTCDDRRLQADDLVGSYECEYTSCGDSSDPWGSGLPCVSMHLGSLVWGEGGVHGSRVGNLQSGQ